MDLITGENVAIILFFIGMYGLVARRNIMKTLISIGVMGSAAVLLFITSNYTNGALPPIGVEDSLSYVDPVPQALMITNIVIGITVTAVALAMFINMYHKYGTTNWGKAKKQRMEREKNK